MRASIVIATMTLAALTACHKPNAGAAGDSAGPAATATTFNHLPARKPGLWIQTINSQVGSRSGAQTRMCLDAETDAKLSALGQGVSGRLCQQSITRGLDGSYTFSATCKMGEAVSVTSKGVASGDFSSAYKVHSESDVTGANFPHPIHRVSDIEAHYAGPCPSGMTPGTVTIGNGSVTFNANKMPNLAAALGGH